MNPSTATFPNSGFQQRLQTQNCISSYRESDAIMDDNVQIGNGHEKNAGKNQINKSNIIAPEGPDSTCLEVENDV